MRLLKLPITLFQVLVFFLLKPLIIWYWRAEANKVSAGDGDIIVMTVPENMPHDQIVILAGGLVDGLPGKAKVKIIRNNTAIYQQQQHDNGDLQFTLNARMQPQWIPHFLSMLKQMENYGKEDVSKCVGLFSSGGSDFKPEFMWPAELGAKGDDDPVVNDDGNMIFGLKQEEQ